MKQNAYQGFKIALQNSELASNSCINCHHLPDFGRTKTKSYDASPSLRNKSWTADQLRKSLKDKTHQGIKLVKGDVERLHALLHNLKDVSDQQFRDLIIKATVMENSGENR